MARKRYTYQDIKDIVEEVGYKLLSIEEEIVNSKGFVLTSTKLLIKCPNPNHESYNVEFNKFKGYNNQQGQRCKQCLVDSQRLSYGEVKEYIESFNYELLSNEYINIHKNLKIKHLECGHVFDMQYANFQQGQRCPKCGIKNRVEKSKFTYDEVRDYIENEGYELLSEYINCLSHLTLKCPNGHIWNTTCFHSFKNQGTRCPYCNNTRGERVIERILNKYNIKHEQQYRFSDCKFKYTLPFDFYLPEHNCCIEFDGEGHYEPFRFSRDKNKNLNKFIETKERDTIKNEYCKNNNIKLIRIPYWDFDNIETILIKELNLK